MKKYDVTILTQSCYINPQEDTEYVRNVMLEDQLVIDALLGHGLSVHRVAWDDPDFDWSTTRYALFRATWDYFHRIAEFSVWLDRVQLQTTLLNSAAIIRWNIDKHYLQDLSDQGVHCAPTLFVEMGDKRSLAEIYREYGHDEIVLKPVFSGGARHTYRLSAADIASHESIFSKLIAVEAMMIQPFQHRIVTEGEKSLVLIGGKFTHAVLKIAKGDDFRVQDDFGGSVHEYAPTAAEISFAEHAVRSCPEPPIYARVDIFNDNDGQIALAELELIEPELWFRRCSPAAAALAQEIAALAAVN